MSRGFGAFPEPGGTRFRVWAATTSLELVIEGDPRSPFTSWTIGPDGLRELFVPGVGAGARYGYRLDGAGPFPDPASRYQPAGVHALSEVIDPEFAWTDAGFLPPAARELVFYELHVGAFTPEGTFEAALRHLPALRELGVTAIELMPVADFAGRHNWGYDGVSLYAPSRNYGRPEDLRRLVDRAHALGLAVWLDCVYNHLGPDGAYHGLFHPGFYAPDVQTPWGAALNFDETHSEIVRAFFLENGLYWQRDFHIDGFRLDATHAITDRGPRHFLAEFADLVQPAGSVIAEDERNLNTLLEPRPAGYGLNGVWADDFHHHVRRAIAGDTDGYYADYSGAPADIADTLQHGWFYRGQFSAYHNRHRGTPTGDLARSRFVICIQNHDQIGNRAMGDRITEKATPESYLAASALLLLAPETPLLFMGQEWAASTPFPYFTDHHAELGPLVTAGRLREFSRFPEFADPAAQARIPDPQAELTFQSAKLRWEEAETEPHAAVWRWYQRLLELRRTLLREGRTGSATEQDGLIRLSWHGPEDTVAALISLPGQSPVLAPAAGHTVLLEAGGCLIVRIPEVHTA